jgi:hypothetical protein
LGYTWIYAGAFLAGAKMAATMRRLAHHRSAKPEQYLTKEQQKACLDAAAAELIREIIQQPLLN